MIWATTSTLGHAFTLPSCGRLVLTGRIRRRGADLVIRVRTIKVARVVDRAWPASHVNIYTSSSHSASTPSAILCNAGSRRAKGVLSSTPQFLGKVKCMGSRQEKKREEKKYYCPFPCTIDPHPHERREPQWGINGTSSHGEYRGACCCRFAGWGITENRAGWDHCRIGQT